MGSPFFDTVVDAILHSYNSSSHFRWSTAGRLLVLEMAFFAIAICHGVFLSYFRCFGLLLYAIGWLVILTLQHGDDPVPWLNMLAILRFEFDGTTLLIPWNHLFIHGAIGAVALALAYVLWSIPVDETGVCMTCVCDDATEPQSRQVAIMAREKKRSV